MRIKTMLFALPAIVASILAISLLFKGLEYLPLSGLVLILAGASSVMLYLAGK